jgi:hypothetical protein
MTLSSPYKRQAEKECDDITETKKANKSLLQEYLQANWVTLCTPMPGLNYIAWLKQKNAWWQHRTKDSKGRTYLDMEQFINTTPAHTLTKLIQLNEPLSWAHIGDTLPCPTDRHGNCTG